MRFSFTRLATYRRCAFQYRCRYQLHLPAPPRPMTRLALALHAALATFYRHLAPTPRLDDLLLPYDAQWPDELIERDARAWNEGRALLIDYFQRHDGHWPRVLFTEVPFTLELGRYTLVGQLDRVDELPDGSLQIVDYKTTREPPQAPDPFQLDLYQLGLAAKTGRLAERVVFSYLRHGIDRVVPVDDRNLRLTLERVERVVAAVESDDVLAPRVGEHCKRCDYIDYCPAQRPDPLPLPTAAPEGQLVLGL
ncbi:MAG: PD-(D/E)XK nuclease family protein [Chloroflexi bacterium]|nr:PD-(D/E)XK nuclease family protein [Chloroflexota bacterium]